MEYCEFGVTDFVLDNKFKQWVLEPNVENSAFWETWISENPEKSSVVYEAKQMIMMLHFHFKNDKTNKKDYQIVWSSLIQAISEDSDSDDLPSSG